MSEVCIDKFRNRLWYLTLEMCALSFYDSTVSDAMKKKMITNLDEIATFEKCKKRIAFKGIAEMEGFELCNLSLIAAQSNF